MRAAGLLILALLLLLPRAAEADGRDKRAAAAHFQQGSALYADGRWSDALAEFEAGYDAYPLRGFLVNIGQCYRKLERLDEASDAWRRFLATHPSDGKLRAEVEEALAEVETARTQSARAETPPEPKSEPRVVEAPPTPIAELAPTPVEPPSENLLVRSAPPTETRKKSRAWVWALVGVAAASVAAAVVTVSVVEWQASQPHGGSLGLIDGRR